MKTTLRSFRPRLLALLALLAAAALLPACGRNGATKLLVPTGIRPAPTDSNGVVYGFVRFDSTLYTGITGTPYPPATVELRRNGVLVATDTPSGARNGFRFDRLPGGLYTVRATAHGFRGSATLPASLTGESRDAGDLYLAASPESLTAIMFVVGTMPGFSVDDAFMNLTTSMLQNTLGIYEYPDPLFGYTPIAAGTYRFKFVTDFSSTPTHLIGWGGDSTVTLVAPVTNSPVRYASGPAEDIKVTIPTSGNWAFVLDERRLTFSIMPAPTALAARAARARTPR